MLVDVLARRQSRNLTDGALLLLCCDFFYHKGPMPGWYKNFFGYRRLLVA